MWSGVGINVRSLVGQWSVNVNEVHRQLQQLITVVNYC
ncbi:hypothetical protein O59_004240 [Cellvibrio sp. BR]|nr:hypothetical protein O59_004240 [Cellvibrio sp. BR]